MPDQILSKVVNQKTGWYRENFHTHTNASDGRYPAGTLTEITKAKGLDFIAITDHNTFTGLAELSRSPDFFIVPGLEVTFDKEHFNILGLDGWHT